MNKLAIKTLFAALLFTAAVSHSAENSITTLINHFESVENLSETKFTKSQFKEITTALENKENKQQ